MRRIPFTKAQGAGNDFLVIEGTPEVLLPSVEARQRICDRHYGVGADGILFLAVPGDGADANLRIFNNDGGEVEISGNGTRCAAAYLIDGAQVKNEFTIKTGAGLKTLTLVSRKENLFEFEMSMGAPILEPAAIPFRPPDLARLSAPVVGFELPVSTGTRKITVTSMGNPHCSIRVDDYDWDWQALGAEIERHPFFPNRTNVEFYRVLSKHEIEVRYWERGVGFTLSSGTGSCGASVAAILNDFVESPVRVKTLAGHLEVIWNRERSIGVILSGPAEIVCKGEYFAAEA